MPGFVGTYIPDRLLVTFGPLILSGWAKDSLLKIEQDGQQTTAVQGADGHVGRAVRQHSLLTKFTASVLQTSETNDALCAIADLDKLSGQGLHPLTIKDLSGTTLYFAPQAWIAKRPNPDFGMEVKNREWVFEGPCETKEGGNF